MNDLIVVVGLGVLGAALGSFAGAQVWRLRARQLQAEKKQKQPYDKQEFARLKPLLSKKGFTDRSIDFDSGEQLKWFELIPVLSWLGLRGKSRYSGKFIGWMEFLLEIGVASFFILSFLCWPQALNSPIEIAKFIIWLVAGVVLAIQFASDCKWKLLWSNLNYITILLGIIYAILVVVSAPQVDGALWSILGSLMILGGLYLVLWFVSRERWVGFGDVLLGFGLALLLSDWALAFVALFAANLIGTILVAVGLVAKKIKRQQQVPFGPLLIIGAFLAQLFGSTIVFWYFSLFLT